MKQKIFILGAALMLLLALSACGRPAATRTTDTLEQPEQSEAEAPAAGMDARSGAHFRRLRGGHAHPPAGACAERARLYV